MSNLRKAVRAQSLRDGTFEQYKATVSELTPLLQRRFALTKGAGKAVRRIKEIAREGYVVSMPPRQGRPGEEEDDEDDDEGRQSLKKRKKKARVSSGGGVEVMVVGDPHMLSLMQVDEYHEEEVPLWQRR